LLNPNEMGNRDLRQLAHKLERSDYAADLRREFDGVFDRPAQTVEALGLCIEAFLISPALAPFSSKFDDFVRGKATLTPLEARGRAAFQDPWFCGAFRTPSRRNVALRRNFMHNGVFSSLREVVTFYATRASNPERWYEHATFDDLPVAYHANVNVTLPPYNRPRGASPLLEDADIDASVAFLETLTDRAIPGASPARD
jgi:cytochrome c peroxidase